MTHLHTCIRVSMVFSYWRAFLDDMYFKIQWRCCAGLIVFVFVWVEGTHRVISFALCNQRRERLESVRGWGLYCIRVSSGGGKSSNLTDRALSCEHTTKIGGEFGNDGGSSLLTTLKVFFGGRQNRGRFTVYSFLLCDLLLEIL